MNDQTLKGQWKQLKGEVQKQWGKLTDDDMDVINGEYDKLVGRVQERYGRTREEAKREVDKYFDRHPSQESTY
ncbi:MAG: CsbD family protein [Ardenticatenaceae bacterium]|nr:CsbD family protein [Ardenticatenaceae bacterium]